MNKIATPFDPFKKEEDKIELHFILGRILSQLGQNLVDSKRRVKSNIDWINVRISMEDIDYKFFVDANHYEKLQNALSSFPNLSSDARNEIILFSLLPRYYKESLRQQAKEKFVKVNAAVTTLKTKLLSDLGRGNNSNVILPQLMHTKIPPIPLRYYNEFLGMSPEILMLYGMMKKITERRIKGKDVGLNEQFLNDLNSMGEIFEFIKKYLPSESSFRNIMISHLYFIIKTEGLFSNINPNNKTDIRITKLIIVLFEASDYFEVGSAEEQIKKVNKAILKKEDILLIKKIKELLSP